MEEENPVVAYQDNKKNSRTIKLWSTLYKSSPTTDAVSAHESSLIQCPQSTGEPWCIKKERKCVLKGDLR